jgi:hypothetical protein
VLLKRQEYLGEAGIYEYIDVNGNRRTVDLPAGSLAYTFCQVPVVYIDSDAEKILVHYAEGRPREVSGCDLDDEISNHILRRDGRIRQLTVYTQPAL